MKGIIKIGTVIGTGATLNVSIGFIPTCVQLYNVSDGTLVTTAFLQWVMPFSSGGTSTVVAGSTIRGATSLATATVQEVLQSTTGSFAAGTAAGFLVLQEGSLVGTFSSENIVITNLATGVVGTDDATVTAAVTHNVAFAAAAASATTTSAMSRYEGSAASAAKGFTIGSVIAVADKALRYIAIRDDG